MRTPRRCGPIASAFRRRARNDRDNGCFRLHLGLTECWRHKSDGAVLQLAPGVAGGDYDPRSYEFWNMTVGEVVRDFLASADLIQAKNLGARMFLSVSPVSIIATSEDRHVLVSNSASKAILRAAATRSCGRARTSPIFRPTTL